MTGYRVSPTKRQSRRTKAEIGVLEDELVQLAAEHQPATVRGIFYQAVGAGLIDKSEAEYKNTVCRLLLRLRRDGRIPYHWIVDGTRLMRKPGSWTSLDHALADIHATYRRNLWDTQPAYVEVWCEKDTLSGQLYDVTAEFDVPLMIARGFSSETFLWRAAQDIIATDKTTHIYHFGDLDPSGVAAATAIHTRLVELVDDAVEITFTRVAVTSDQVAELNLPTRPTKRSDSRSKNWVGDSVEVDALPSRVLRQVCRDAIEQHLDPAALWQTKIIEQGERDDLAELMGWAS